jgi:hypothetical protein
VKALPLLKEREEWGKAFDYCLKFGSEGLLAPEILEAKKVFFAKTGAAYEMKEEVFETASRTFLEWYLFDYPTRLFGKCPAVVLATLETAPSEIASWIKRSLHNRWSLFEVLTKSEDTLTVCDLMTNLERQIWIDRENLDSKVWNIEKGQIIQARLFSLESSSYFFLTHLWIHSDAEAALLKKICAKLSLGWQKPHSFLIDAFESIVRSLEVQNQVRWSGRSNWLYQELKKRYAH